jgi:hypothetical protein
VSEVKDILAYLRKNRLISILVISFILVFLGFGMYQATSKRITFLMSENNTTLTLNGKMYSVSSNKLSLALRAKDYQLKVEKAGFETYYKVINASETSSVKVPLRVKLSDALTAALPKSVNQAGIEYKVKEPTYLEGGKWAVAEVVQFDIDQSDLPDLYAVFTKSSGKWRLVAGPAPEFLDDQAVDKLMPKKVYDYLERQL